MNRRTMLFAAALTARATLGLAEDTSLHDLGMQLVGRGRMVEAEAVLHRALATEDPADASRTDLDRRVRQLSTLDVLASLAQARGDAAQAEALVRRAVAVAEQPPRLTGVPAAGALSSLARLLLVRGETGDAKRLASRSLKLYEKCEGAARVERADALATLAMVVASRGDLSEAQALLRDARRVVEIENGRPALQAMVLGHLGALRMAQGRYPEAEALFEQGLELGVQVMGDNHPALVPLMQALAECYRLRARGAEAGLLFDRALGIASFAYGRGGSPVR